MIKIDYVDFATADVKKTAAPGAQPRLSVRIDILDATNSGEKVDIVFSYSAEYVPDKIYLKLMGNAGFSGGEIKAAYDVFKKTKSFPDETRAEILTILNHVCSINSVLIARVFNLTPPIIAPQITRTAAPGAQPQQKPGSGKTNKK